MDTDSDSDATIWMPSTSLGCLRCYHLDISYVVSTKQTDNTCYMYFLCIIKLLEFFVLHIFSMHN